MDDEKSNQYQQKAFQLALRPTVHIDIARGGEDSLSLTDQIHRGYERSKGVMVGQSPRSPYAFLLLVRNLGSYDVKIQIPKRNYA